MPSRLEEISLGGTLSIDSYLLTYEIARGNIGSVYLAYEERNDRLVAVKILKPELCLDSRIVELFYREASITAKLNHPNIVKILAQGVFRGLPYFVMELIEGENLAEVAKQQEIHPKQALEYLMQASLGLAAAWEEGHVHRDIKAENLLLDGKGRLKVSDFGCVTDLGAKPKENSASFVLGTPHFMSPEQAKGLSVDCRSDIYSLGATFYYLLSSQHPFEGDSVMEILLHQIHSPLRPLHSLKGELPRALCWVIDAMLAKDPKDRYQNYEELFCDLKKLEIALSASRPITAKGVSQKREKEKGLSTKPDFSISSAA